MLQKYLKRALALSVVLVLLVGSSVYADTTDTQTMMYPEQGAYSGESQFPYLVDTENDKKNNYVNYSENEIIVPVNRDLAETELVDNIVGMVFDFITEEPVAGATVNASNGITIKTDENGRFQIRNMPEGTYDWEIKADGYYMSLYTNYTLYTRGGTNIFTFFVRNDEPMISDGGQD